MQEFMGGSYMTLPYQIPDGYGAYSGYHIDFSVAPTDDTVLRVTKVTIDTKSIPLFSTDLITPRQYTNCSSASMTYPINYSQTITDSTTTGSNWSIGAKASIEYKAVVATGKLEISANYGESASATHTNAITVTDGPYNIVVPANSKVVYRFVNNAYNAQLVPFCTDMVIKGPYTYRMYFVETGQTNYTKNCSFDSTDDSSNNCPWLYNNTSFKSWHVCDTMTLVKSASTQAVVYKAVPTTDADCTANIPTTSNDHVIKALNSLKHSGIKVAPKQNNVKIKERHDLMNTPVYHELVESSKTIKHL